MSDDPKEPTETSPDEAARAREEENAPDSAAMRNLLKRASTVPVPPPKADVLRGVQRRIRQRSKGKFYSDGWSTREDNPRSTYLITAAVMLLLVAIVYLALAPGGVGRLP